MIHTAYTLRSTDYKPISNHISMDHTVKRLEAAILEKKKIYMDLEFSNGYESDLKWSHNSMPFSHLFLYCCIA